MTKRATGEPLLEIELGKHGTYVVADDGDPDSYVNGYVEKDDERINTYLTEYFKRLREDNDDDDLLREFGSSHSTTTSYDRGPSAFKCEDCNKTWPRGSNEGDDKDLCPKCA